MVVPLPPSSSHPNALLIAGEISRLLASIRSSKRWASSGNRFTVRSAHTTSKKNRSSRVNKSFPTSFTQEEEVEDDISESLKSLRRDIFAWEGMIPSPSSSDQYNNLQSINTKCRLVLRRTPRIPYPIPRSRQITRNHRSSHGHCPDIHPGVSQHPW